MLSRAFTRFASRSLRLAPVQISQPSTRFLSKSDSEFLNYLDDQLDHEKPRNIGTISGWSKIEIEGAIGKVSKTQGNENVTVRFNLNGAMPTLAEQDEMEANNEEVLCLPDFEVIVENGGGKKIWINCVFDQEDNVDDQGNSNEQESDPFEIISITIADDDTDFPYVMNMDAMDPTFYDQIYNFLEERGVTEQFVEDMAVAATDVENNLYRGALENLRTFIKN